MVTLGAFGDRDDVSACLHTHYKQSGVQPATPVRPSRVYSRGLPPLQGREFVLPRLLVRALELELVRDRPVPRAVEFKDETEDMALYRLEEVSYPRLV